MRRERIDFKSSKLLSLAKVSAYVTLLLYVTILNYNPNP